jgi:BirA family transcriptional regulator, biotin operon repressor / biotin---[acetyl-CoA-carboxylase] ligase
MTPPYSALHREVTDSTQDDARAAFVDDPVLVVAGAQRQGRGRAASRWMTAPRAMAASLAMRPGWDSADLPLLPLLAGVAAARTVECGLKWPNDLLVEGRKVGGILVESADGVAVVGLGLNLWWPDAPAGMAAIHQADPGPDLASELGERWAQTLLDLVRDGPAAWPRAEYLAACVTVGCDITWQPAGSGHAVDIAPGGGLVVTTPTGPTTLHAGEVRHVRRL